MHTEELFDLMLSDHREIRYKMGFICSCLKEMSKKNESTSFDDISHVVQTAKKIIEISESDLKKLRNEMSKKEGSKDDE